MLTVEQAKNGEWSIWSRGRRYLARFATEAEALAAASAIAPAPIPYVRPAPKLTKLEAAALQAIEAGPVTWPGMSPAVAGLERKGVVSVEKTEAGYCIAALQSNKEG